MRRKRTCSWLINYKYRVCCWHGASTAWPCWNVLSCREQTGWTGFCFVITNDIYFTLKWTWTFLRETAMFSYIFILSNCLMGHLSIGLPYTHTCLIKVTTAVRHAVYAQINWAVPAVCWTFCSSFSGQEITRFYGIRKFTNPLKRSPQFFGVLS
jgi:hypothetical protein